MTGSYVNPKNMSEITQKTLCKYLNISFLSTVVIGFFNFSRCARKSGALILPQQIGLKISEDIEVKVGVKEKNTFGGYRCISLKVFDTKGGDFVENPELTMVVVETHHHSIVTEIGKEMPL